jgi:hypothetical protein
VQLIHGLPQPSPIGSGNIIARLPSVEKAGGANTGLIFYEKCTILFSILVEIMHKIIFYLTNAYRGW